MFFKVPSAEKEWEDIANAFMEKWNFCNCIGALDGKHVNIKYPKNTGSYYFKYKGTLSVVLHGLVDADYKFIYIDVGCNGRISDGGVFRNATLSNALVENTLNIPNARCLPGGQERLPFVIEGDAAFPLKGHLIKPYPHRQLSREQRICNYRISRVRRVVENAFVILASRFRVFLTTINLPVVEKLVLASCVLHNYFRSEAQTRYTHPAH